MTVVVPDEERYRRVVEDGSRRKRDLSVYRRLKAEGMREREAVMGPTHQVADAAWQEAAARLRSSVPESTFRLWIEPLRGVGADGDTLLLDGPEGIRAWAERRYSALIAQALQGVSGFRSVAFVSAEESA